MIAALRVPVFRGLVGGDEGGDEALLHARLKLVLRQLNLPFCLVALVNWVWPAFVKYIDEVMIVEFGNSF